MHCVVMVTRWHPNITPPPHAYMLTLMLFPPPIGTTISLDDGGGHQNPTPPPPAPNPPKDAPTTAPFQPKETATPTTDSKLKVSVVNSTTVKHEVDKNGTTTATVTIQSGELYLEVLLLYNELLVVQVIMSISTSGDGWRGRCV